MGGSSIRLGDTSAGQLIDCPLPDSGPWTMAGIDDVSLAQSAYHLTRGKIALADSPLDDWPAVQITKVGSIAGHGPYDLDIYQNTTTGSPRGPFDIISPPTVSVPTYPVIWAHNAKAERNLIIEPDGEGQIKTVSPKYRSYIESQARRQHGYVAESLDDRMKDLIADRVLKAEKDLRQNALGIWATATRAHYNRDLRFNSQSLVVSMTERKSIGGRAWPSVIFDDDEQEYAFALWSNSTLGLLLHWWTAKQDPVRPRYDHCHEHSEHPDARHQHAERRTARRGARGVLCDAGSALLAIRPDRRRPRPCRARQATVGRRPGVAILAMRAGRADRSAAPQAGRRAADSRRQEDPRHLL